MQPTHTVQATITDHVTFTPGDGAPVIIPKGPVEIEVAAESAILSWTADNDASCVAALTLTQYKEYVRDKKIIVTQ